jgi:hypothetical protein
MKKLLILIFALTPALLYTSCKKDDEVSKVVDVSYPSIKLNGDKYVSVAVGQAYDDPGAVATDDLTGGTSSIKSESSTLDVNTPGLYYMEYSAKNSNGYITHVGRYIAVTDFQDDFDLSGLYERTSNGVQVNLTKVARGLYMTDDMGGAGLGDAGYFAVLDAETIRFGPQLSESLGSEIEGADEALTVDATDTSYSYKLFAPGYGTGQRTFVKVPE